MRRCAVSQRCFATGACPRHVKRRWRSSAAQMAEVLLDGLVQHFRWRWLPRRHFETCWGFQNAQSQMIAQVDEELMHVARWR